MKSAGHTLEVSRLQDKRQTAMNAEKRILPRNAQWQAAGLGTCVNKVQKSVETCKPTDSDNYMVMNEGKWTNKEMSREHTRKVRPRLLVGVRKGLGLEDG
ncbi:uncharacterized protein EAE97_004399 [Botrytis byssoidea]|uniref:Uncharacterized protein n=1 Tax=Botrytis byssoidea TaxID=139641 RepID=A0A9P5M6K1_9HELO|nr:uncharacterized protein EAE97_004399 [Botrytis byssoidea]KAF7947150.1 hypothetical protein EAE97_004399 [Botrytis byssoidea]